LVFTIIIENNFNLAVWLKKMNRFLTEPSRGLSGDSRKRLQTRNNLVSEVLRKDELTIENFFKALDLFAGQKHIFTLRMKLREEHTLERLSKMEFTVSSEVSRGELLNKPKRGKVLLVDLFQQMLDHVQINDSERETLIRAYIEDPRNQLENNKDKNSSTRSNIRKYFTAKELSWLNYTKTLALIQVDELEFELKIRWNKRVETTHVILATT
jgi:hypothetical protein